MFLIAQNIICNVPALFRHKLAVYRPASTNFGRFYCVKLPPCATAVLPMHLIATCSVICVLFQFTYNQFASLAMLALSSHWSSQFRIFALDSTYTQSQPANLRWSWPRKLDLVLTCRTPFRKKKHFARDFIADYGSSAVMKTPSLIPIHVVSKQINSLTQTVGYFCCLQINYQ